MSKAPHSHVCKWNNHLEDQDGTPLLSYFVHPFTLPPLSKRLRRRILAYHQAVAQRWVIAWETKAYEEAKRAHAQADAQSLPFTPYSMALTTSVASHQQNLLCIRQDVTEDSGDGRPIHYLQAVTWDLASGFPLPLSAFYEHSPHWKKIVLDAVCKEGRQRANSGMYLLDEPVEPTLHKHFDAENYLLTDDGLSLFYPMYTIAPHVEQIPFFPLPTPDFPLAGNGKPQYNLQITD